MPENEKTKKLKEILKNLSLNEGMIRDNKIEFEYNKNKYRVRMPNTGEELEANEKKNELYIKLLNDDKYMTENQLIKTFKKKGIDLKKLDDELKELVDKMNNEQLKLAKLPDKNKKAIEMSESRIINLKDKQIEVSQKKANYLQYSIESKVEHFYYMYTSYLITEKLIGEVTEEKTLKGRVIIRDKWIKCFKDYKEFENSETELVGKAITWTTNLLLGLRNPLM